MTANEALLRVERLRIEVPTRRGILVAVDDVSFAIAPGEVLGVVGESGAGKSLTGAAVIGLLEPPLRIAGGQILLDGRRIDNLPYEAMRRIRGKEIGAIFQDPLTSLNPLYTIGRSSSRRSAPISTSAPPRRTSVPCHCCAKSAFPGRSSASTTTRTNSLAACASAW